MLIIYNLTLETEEELEMPKKETITKRLLKGTIKLKKENKSKLQLWMNYLTKMRVDIKIEKSIQMENLNES